MQNDLDFSQALADVVKLGQCFWRFPQIDPVIKTVVSTLHEVMEKKKRQLKLYLRQVQGQFDIIKERVAQQRSQFSVIETHLRREEEFRQKVFNRETTEVMKLIEEYEKMAILQQEKANKEFRYSDLMPDLAFI